jgi:acetoin:2,6-dichlorophenolindophenol oxidoreductase subunit alpha
VWNLPVIFYCENNQYAMTTPFADSSALPNVADRAVAYAMPGTIVDGQDVLACWRVTQEAVARARSGNGPSLIEAKTYRYQAHSYRVRESRPPEEVELGRQRDPLALFQAQLTGSGAVSEVDLAEVRAAVDEEISAGVEFARASEVPEPGEAFTDVYAGDVPVAQGDPQW